MKSQHCSPEDNVPSWVYLVKDGPLIGYWCLEVARKSLLSSSEGLEIPVLHSEAFSILSRGERQQAY